MPDERTSSTMLGLLFGSVTTQALHVAAVLGIADQLAGGPRTSAELASATGSHRDTLHRLLRYLAALGVFAGDDSAGFTLTPLGELLRKDVEGTAYHRAIVFGTYNYRAVGDLLQTVRTGEPAFERVFGTSFYDYLGQQPETARNFDQSMLIEAPFFFSAVPEQYDFSSAGTVVDVAGGNGTLIATILAATPGVRGVLFDAPHVVEAARGRLADAGVLDRCELVGGDFFETVPAGGDIYVLSRVLHNWDDEDCGRLLAKTREAMRPDSRLLILERLVHPGTPAPFLATDINMLTLFGGRELTVPELRTMLEKVGLELTEQHQLPLEFSLAVARRTA